VIPDHHPIERMTRKHGFVRERLDAADSDDGGRRYRWSVAFPIIESFAIVPPCYANEVLTAEAMTRLFAHPSGTLRPLNSEERWQIAGLEIASRPTINAWIGIADEAAMAEKSEIDPETIRLINRDIALAALEGHDGGTKGDGEETRRLACGSFHPAPCSCRAAHLR
jgi:hypothetical protein